MKLFESYCIRNNSSLLLVCFMCATMYILYCSNKIQKFMRSIQEKKSTFYKKLYDTQKNKSTKK